ncbi:hypothetical protein evm_000225 [Chilo suppressalis]|nr:hypothetical protein evm_000225 [Chilo suppressalis]
MHSWCIDNHQPLNGTGRRSCTEHKHSAGRADRELSHIVFTLISAIALFLFISKKSSQKKLLNFIKLGKCLIKARGPLARRRPTSTTPYAASVAGHPFPLPAPTDFLRYRILGVLFRLQATVHNHRQDTYVHPPPPSASR